MTFNEFKSKYPSVISLSCGFHGSGDSFDEFSDYEGVWLDENSTKVQIPEDALDMIFHDFNDILWDIIDKDDRADFNNEGCSGTIKVNLKNGRVVFKIHDYEEDSESFSDDTYNLMEDETRHQVACKEAFMSFVKRFPSVKKITGTYRASCDELDEFCVDDSEIVEEKISNYEKVVFKGNTCRDDILSNNDYMLTLVTAIIERDGRSNFADDGCQGTITINFKTKKAKLSGSNNFLRTRERCENHWLITETQGIIEDAEEV